VVVSADIALSWGFLNYASRLNRDKLLRRVVINKCHLTFTLSDWRPKLAELQNLRLLQCPIVLLTVTLPPLLEQELSEVMLVPLATYIRASTVQVKTRYTVQWCQGGKIKETALVIYKRQARRLNSIKGVIYYRSQEQCEELARKLRCEYYHAGLVNRED
jgi:superfamily II DNA helicase RecQ